MLAPSLARAQTELPPPLHWESAAFDPERGRLVLFGGTGPAGYLSSTLQWNGTRWSAIADSASSPGARHAHAMGWDAARSRVVLFGGIHESRDTTIPPAQRERFEKARERHAVERAQGGAHSARSAPGSESVSAP